ncbi:phosphotransferase enzyme family protein [Amycolatopsis sp. NPDC059027]|uniref:phosphotransferase enzyme family protein n=1 Tax=Amycolatopsis sp. NPDC059027 TaxID=3346709 RepID=UPI0036723F2B
MELDDAVLPFLEAAKLRDVSLAGEGLEFAVYRAESPEHGTVALRVPKETVYRNVNDPHVSAEALLEQEWAILTYLAGGDVPVPVAHRLLRADGRIALLTGYVDADGREPDPAEVGRGVARLHAASPPPITPVAQENLPTPLLLGRRITRRWAEAAKLVPDLPGLPAEERLAEIARGLDRFGPSLLHLDVRGSNLRARDGRLLAFVDWSNALIGPAALDLYRILENEKPADAFLAGYAAVRPLPELSDPEELLLRLDAAVMLALVFLSEAPDAERAPESIRRVTELATLLDSVL